MKKALVAILTGIGLVVFMIRTTPPSLATTPVFCVDTGGTLTTSLISYYPMQGNSNDFWGSNNGTDSNITYGTSYGKVNEGALFNGSNSLINTNYNPGSQSAFSIAAWANPSSFPHGDNYVVANWNFGPGVGSSGNERVIRLEFSSAGYPMFYATTGGTDGTGNGIAGSSAASTNTWHFIVGTFDGSTLRLYLDNSLIGTASLSGSIYNSASPLYIGGDVNQNGSNGGFFAGDIDEVGLWTKTLSTTEITDLYNGGAGQTMTTSCGGGTAPMSWTTIMMF